MRLSSQANQGSYTSGAPLSRDSVQHILAVIIGLAAIAARLFIANRTHATGEDALITLRYADSVAAGRGFAYNPSEHVLGVTTPLYCLLLALFESLHLNAMFVGKVCCIVADGVTTYFLARLLARKEIDQPVAGLYAAVLYAFTSTPISVSISGMETGIVTCVGIAMIYAFTAKRPFWLYSLGGILVLLRIDGLLLFLILAGSLLLRERKFPARAGALFLIIVLPWILYATLTFGSPVPTSLLAKITVYGHPSFAPHGPGLKLTAGNREAFVAQFAGGWVQRILSMLFGLGAVLVIYQAARKGDRGVLAAPMVWLLVYYSVMLTSRVPAFPWYFLPPWPVFIAIACIAGATGPKKLATLNPQLVSEWGSRAAPVGLGLLAAMGMLHLPSIMREIRESQRIEDTLRIPVGLWLRDHVAKGDRVMLEPIGYIGYYSGCRVLDTIGLVSPEVLPSYQKNNGIADPRTDIIQRLRPEWLCLRGSEEAALSGSSVFSLKDAYRREVRFETAHAEPFVIYHVR